METINETYYNLDENCRHLNFNPRTHAQMILAQQGFAECSDKATILFAKVIERMFKETIMIDEALREFSEYAEEIEPYFNLDDPANYHYLIDGEKDVFTRIWTTKASSGLRDLSLTEIGLSAVKRIEELYNARVENYSKKSL